MSLAHRMKGEGEIKQAHMEIITAMAVIKPRNNARLNNTSMNPRRKKPKRKAKSPVCRVVMVVIAMPIVSGSRGCLCGSE